MDIQCNECLEPFPDSQSLCPHCGRPSLYPNIAAALRPEERAALKKRYEVASIEAKSRNCDSTRRDFEAAILAEAKIVISTNFNELERIVRADTQVFPTFYQRVRAGLQIPKGGKWDVLRAVAEHAAFPGYKEHIRFGVLSLDGSGLRNYGECSMVMKDKMVIHRTSLFEDNNVVFTVYEQKTTMAEAVELKPGYRAIWEDREKLCIAKLHRHLVPTQKPTDFASLLLVQGATTIDDRFVELHIWGSLTVRSVERVRIHRQRHRPLKAAIEDVTRLLDHYHVSLDPV